MNIQNQLMEMPHITAGEEVKTNPKELWRMTQVPAYALDKAYRKNMGSHQEADQ